MIVKNTGLAEERLRLIMSLLKDRGILSVEELCAELVVSGATVRRDLAELDSRGQVRRVHGGVVSVEAQLGEPIFDDKAKIAAVEKQRIAEAAVKLINPSDSIFLDGGSTVLAMARLLTEMKKLTVVTNSLKVVSALYAAGPRIIVIGGEYRRISQTFVGAMTRPMIDLMHMDKAFMGTIGMKDGVLTTTDPAEALTKELVISHAHKVILMADTSKFEKVSFVKFGQMEPGVTLVTDSGITKGHEKFCRIRSVEIIKA